MAKRAPRPGEGRPTDYGPHIIKLAQEYLALCEDKEVELGPEDRPIYKIKVKIPTIDGLAVYLKVSRETIYAWEREPGKQEFSDVLAQLRAEQADRLMNNGLSGDYNPTIAKVLLTKHGYREGIENSGEGGGPLKIDITDQLNKTYGRTDEVPGDSA